jgi:hypothetical protein
MKQLLSIVVVLLTLNGCVKRALAPAAHLVLPRQCITDMRFAQDAVCHARSDGSFSCNGVVVQASCTKSMLARAGCKVPTGIEQASK